LGRELKKVETAGADLIHVDVMDGQFVPNITIGPVVIKDVKGSTKLPLDVHLMIQNPEKLIDAFVKAGSDMITVHIETVSEAAIREQSIKLKSKGVKFGVSLNPATPLYRIEGVLKYVDFVLVMTVNPGFAGQEFIVSVLPKIRKLRLMFEGDISVDGGINEKTAKVAVASGASILVAGSYIFKSTDYRRAIRRLRCEV
jgi:ribulose-phosphate 3-epimerase